jgi:AraC family transcriptional regulator
MLTILRDVVHDEVDGRDLTGLELVLPAKIDGQHGRLFVSVRRFDELPIPARQRQVRKLSREEVERAHEAIKTRLPTGVRIGAIADLLGISASQFSRSFRASLGVTFTTYVVRLRLESAMQLMSETDLPLSEVALRSGFGDQSHFSRTFVRSVGVTPFKWRSLQSQSAIPPSRNSAIRLAS